MKKYSIMKKISTLFILFFGLASIGFAQTVAIGTQVWSTKNLDVSTFRNGDPIPQAKTNEEWKKAGENQQPAWCYHDNNPNNSKKYGKLYNWYAVNDPRGLAPEGWYVPTNAEWTVLTKYLGGEFKAGIKLRYPSGWENLSSNGVAEINESRFSGLPAGQRYYDGAFDDVGVYGGWWSSTEDNTKNARAHGLSCYIAHMLGDGVSKGNGRSVRCLRGGFASRDAAQIVTIGNQQWMSKNLDLAFYRNGDPIPQVTDPIEWRDLTTGAWCFYNNDPSQGNKYGKLYNWYAVNDPRGLAPQGWHIPSDAEWTALETTLGGSSVAGAKMKEPGTLNWATPNTGADNSSGWAGLPGGYRNQYRVFGNVSNIGYWWSSTAYDANFAWVRTLYYDGGNINRAFNFKPYGYSVRCLRD
jgi:uncharacterized protein (TIGR02145 family)